MILGLASSIKIMCMIKFDWATSKYDPSYQSFHKFSLIDLFRASPLIGNGFRFFIFIPLFTMVYLPFVFGHMFVTLNLRVYFINRYISILCKTYANQRTGFWITIMLQEDQTLCLFSPKYAFFTRTKLCTMDDDKINIHILILVNSKLISETVSYFGLLQVTTISTLSLNSFKAW